MPVWFTSHAAPNHDQTLSRQHNSDRYHSILTVRYTGLSLSEIENKGYGKHFSPPPPQTIPQSTVPRPSRVLSFVLNRISVHKKRYLTMTYLFNCQSEFSVGFVAWPTVFVA